jgi:hypothetical protein
LAAYWTIQHTIDMKVAGVGFSVDVFTVEPSGKSYAARKLDDTEVADHAEFMRTSEEALRRVRHDLTAVPAGEPPVEAPPTLKPLQ